MAAVCGIDWACEYDDIRIADEHAGTVLAERRFAHDEPGVAGLIELLICQHVARVAIERSDGLPVGRLLAAGITVPAIHLANQLRGPSRRWIPSAWPRSCPATPTAAARPPSCCSTGC